MGVTPSSLSTMLLTYREVAGTGGPRDGEVVSQGLKAARTSAQDQERPTPYPPRRRLESADPHIEPNG
eukprot:5755271-Alexandrium_andersonii.AAC.1